MNNWWEFYHKSQITKLLKPELQLLANEYNINPNQRRELLINELIKKLSFHKDIEIETILDENDDIDIEIYYPKREVKNCNFDYDFRYDGKYFKMFDNIREHDYFLRIKLQNINYVDHEEIKMEINSILDIIKKPNTFPIVQPENMITLLLEHQKQNIQWMKDLEDSIDNGDKLTISNYWPYLIPLHKQIVYSTLNYRFKYHVPQEISLTYRGGILADEMGLGKTLNCIGLMLQNSRKPSNNNSKANLVLCPSHLAEQWYNEIINNTIDMKVAMIRTKKDWDMLTYYDLLTCDVVIVTHQFLINPNYNPNSRWNYNNQTSPSLHKINWHRIFLDEGHELVFNTTVFSSITNLQSKYKWYVSGTPFVDGNIMDYPDFCIYQISKFLEIDIREFEVRAPNSIHTIRPNIEYMKQLTRLMIRNTKDTIDFHLPEIKIQDKLLDFHKTERGRYDIAKKRSTTSKKWLLQLCCSMNLADQDIKEFGVEKTLEQIHEIMIINQEEKLQKKKNTLENTIPKRQDTVLTEERKENIKRLQIEISDIEKSLMYLKTIFNQIKDEQTCPICLDVIENLAITDCGHIFCVDCIEQCLETSGKCPNCRNITNYMIVGNNENNEMINNYGTKITELIKHLKQINDKVIIFSQWDRLLHKVSDILKDEGLDNLFCQGSIFKRNNSLREFRKNNINILMMSLDYAVSGTNLTEAKEVIILDIYDGSADDIKKKENQAIGRIHRLGQKDNIKVTRFVIKDTLEEILYKKLINNNKTNEILYNDNDENLTII